MSETKDIYDQAVEALTALPDEEFRDAIREAWSAPYRHKYGCLFMHTGNSVHTGCLTQVKRGNFPAPTPELTAEIKADPRLPSYSDGITKESLPAFAEWQRRLHPVSE